MSKIFKDYRKPMSREEIMAKVNAPVAAPVARTERTDDIAPIEQYEVEAVSTGNGEYVEDGKVQRIRNISFLK